jgi:uncharacterized membrane protein HdeD (DUF308 family)
MSAQPYPINRTWWVFVVAGVLNVVVGLLAIAHPDFTVAALGIVLGLGLLFASITAFLAGLAGGGELRVLGIVIGVIGLIAALVCLKHPSDSLLVLVVGLGIYLTAVGVIRVVVALAEPGPRTLVVVVGGIEIVLGILILSLPHVSLGTLAILFGLAILIRGVFDIVAGLAVRRIRDDAAPMTVAGPGVSI